MTNHFRGLSSLAVAAVVAAFMAFVIATGPARAQASAAPTCTGSNLLKEIEANDPAAFAQIIQDAQATENSEAIFWRVERDGVAPSYLFGTVHVTDARVNDLPEQALQALKRAETLAVEIAGLDGADAASSIMSMGSELIFTDGRKLSDFLSQGEVEQARTLLAGAGMPAGLADMVKPWFVSVLLAAPACEHKRSAAGLATLDSRLEQIAANSGARTIGLETPAEQLKAMASLPLKAQIAWLQANLAMADRIEDSYETLIQLYLERRLAVIWPLTRYLSRDVEDLDLALEGFQKALLEIRNRTMAERALPLLGGGNAFVAVGALHLPGETGLVKLFSEAGYTLSPID